MKRFKSDIPLEVRLRSMFFKSSRGDYYDYLAMLIEITGGKRTLVSIFANDAIRYGPKSNRGVLSKYWAAKFAETPSLKETFKGTIPTEDLNFISRLEDSGSDSLQEGLKDLAHLVRFKNRLSSLFKKFFLVFILCTIFIIISVFGIGYYGAPEIASAFTEVDPSQYRNWSVTYFSFSEEVRENGHYYVAAIIAFLIFLPIALANLIGPIRDFLDNKFLFSLYRKVKSIYFLQSLAVLVKSNSSSNGISLTYSLDLLSENENKWMKWHITKMQDKVNEAQIGTETFNTGFLDKEVVWFLEDMAEVSDFNTAIERSKDRVENHTILKVEKNVTLSIALMYVTSIIVMAVMVILTKVVIDEMTSLMKLLTL